MIIQGNALSLPIADNTIQCVVTSPPYYGLRDYGISDQIGIELNPDYVKLAEARLLATPQSLFNQSILQETP